MADTSTKRTILGLPPSRRTALLVSVVTGVLVLASAASHAALISTIDDPRITESSALTISKLHKGIAYTINDDEAVVYAIDIKTGDVKSAIELSGVNAVDPEALALDYRGGLWVADVGGDNRQWSTEPPTLYKIAEPASLDADQAVPVVKKFPIVYSDGAHHDVEAFLINPVTGRKFLVTNVDDTPGRRVALPKTLVADQPNVGKVKELLQDSVSDGSFSPNGRWAVIRAKKKAYSYDTSTSPWTLHTKWTLPVLNPNQPESLAFHPNGLKFLIGSEGSNSQLFWVAFDQASGGPPGG